MPAWLGLQQTHCTTFGPFQKQPLAAYFFAIKAACPIPECCLRGLLRTLQGTPDQGVALGIPIGFQQASASLPAVALPAASGSQVGWQFLS